MSRRLQKALADQKKQTKQEVPEIAGSLGIPLGGQKRIEVPNRNSFVYVRLRDNPNEVIQAFNNKVSASYGLPVLIEWQNGRHIVTGVDTLRYQNTWPSFSPYLARHGNTHSFSTENGGGGDITFVYPRQFMPSLVMPSGSVGGPNVIVNGYTLKNSDGTWRYTGVTGSQNITPYRPNTGTQAVMVLVYLDSQSGNPYLLVGSGSYFPSTITGSAEVLPYVPALTNPNYIPLSAIRIVTGTTAIGWDNIYDVRQFIHTTPTGTGGGSSGGQFAIYSSDYNEVYITGGISHLLIDNELVDDSSLLTVSNPTTLQFNSDGWYSLNLVTQYVLASGSSLPVSGDFLVQLDNTGPFDNSFLRVYTKSGETHFYDNTFQNSSVEMSAGDTLRVQLNNNTGVSYSGLVQELRIEKL